MPSASTVAELQVVVGADTSAAEKSLDALGTKVGSVGSTLATAFGGAAIAGIAGLAAGLGASVAAASDFEKSMSGIKAVSGATAAQMEDMSKLALQLGADTSFSAKEAADGIGELVKAGVSMSDIMGGAGKASLDLAAAGGIAVADAATLAAQAMNIFAIKGADMGKVADTIAGAANASAIDVNQFKFSLSAAGTVAATVGFSFDDLAQAIAVMGQNGLVGSDAGTSLKTMMTALQPSTKAATEKFKELGLITKSGANAFFDATGKVKSMSEVAGILQKSLAGQTEQQRLATLQTLFGSDAIRAAAILAKTGAEGFNDMADAMGKVSAADVAATRLDNLSGSLEKLEGSLSTVAITVGLALTPLLKDLVDYGTDLVNAWGPTVALWAQQLPGAIQATIAVLKAQLQPVVEWFTTTGLPALRTALGTIGTAVAALTTTAWPLLTAAMQAVVDWWATVYVPAVTAVVSWLVDRVGTALTWLATTGWPLLQGAMVAVAAWVTTTLVPTLTAAWSWLQEKLGGVITWLTETGWPKLGEAANKVQNWIKETLIPTLTDWYSWLDQKLQPIYTWFTEQGWPLLQSAGATVWTWLTGTLFPALSEWYDWLQARLSPIFEWFATEGWPAFQTAGAVVVTWITGPLAAALKDWYEWLQDRLSPIFEWFTTEGWPAFQTAGAFVWNWLVTNLIPALQEWYSWMGEKAKDAAEWWIGQGFPKLTGGFKELNPQAAQGAKDWTAFADALSRTDAGESWVAILANLSAFGKYLIENINLGDWFKDIANGAAEASGWADYIAEAVAWILRTIKKWSDAFPGQRDLPDVGEPPKPPSGNAGGGGGGGSGAVPAPPNFVAPPEPSPAPSPSPSPSPSPTPAPSPSPSPGGAEPTGMALVYAIEALGTGIGGQAFGRAAAAIARSEGADGDLSKPGAGGARGPFQFDPGGELQAYASYLHVGMAAAGDYAGSHPIEAATWALKGYLGGALNGGLSLGLNGYKLANYGSRYGQRPQGSEIDDENNPGAFWARAGRWHKDMYGYAAGGWAGLHGPELAWLGERGPEYVVPNSALRGGGSAGAMQSVSMPIVIGDRVIEELWITGRDLAIRRGRVPGAGAASMGSLGR